MTIRGELNLLYAMSKLIVSILDAAEDSQIACDTLRSVSESIRTKLPMSTVKSVNMLRNCTVPGERIHVVPYRIIRKELIAMKQIYGVDSIFGNGKTFYDEDGQLIGYSVDSVIGEGQNFYNADGQHVGYSVNSILGNGQSLYSDNDGLVGHTIDCIFGNGQNIYDADGMSAGFTIESVLGDGQDIFFNDSVDESDNL